MPVSLSTENAPKSVVEAAARDDERQATPAEIVARVHRLGLLTPSEAAELIRADLDGR